MIGIQGPFAGFPAENGICPKHGVDYEPMFVFNRFKDRAADGLDLAVEFSTLGEYGFLPEGHAREFPNHSGRVPEPISLPLEAPAHTRTRRPACSSADYPRTNRRKGSGRPNPRAARLASVPRIQVIGALRTPRLKTDWAA